MRRFKNYLVGVDQGDEMLFSDFVDGGPMWSGEGPREKRVSVKFAESYQSPPAVQVAMTMWDMGHEANQRADINAENISEDGFDIVFKTWGNTRVARVRASWMSIGPLKHDDTWELY